MSILSSRETKAYEFLAAIAATNDAGSKPSKADLVGNVPTQTRAGQYRIIDGLARRGLVRNDGHASRYQLVVTDLGRGEL